MAYRFRRSESVPENVKRIACSELAEAVQHLHGHNKSRPDEAIHEARKDIKKVRSLMRLVQGDLGSAYEKDAPILRDTGRELSPVRDADALIQALDDLPEKRGKIPPRVFATLRRALLKHRRNVEEELGVKALLPKLGSDLAKARNSIRLWPVKADGFGSLAEGLEQAYRRGREAMAHARKHPDRESWHEWRKRVKDHWYHVRLLEDVWSEGMKSYEQSLKELQDCLGDDLTLGLLGEHLSHAPETYGRPADLQRVMALIEARRKELRTQALELGRRTYGQKPRKLTAEFGRLWQAWQDKTPATP